MSTPGTSVILDMIKSGTLKMPTTHEFTAYSFPDVEIHPKPGGQDIVFKPTCGKYDLAIDLAADDERDCVALAVYSYGLLTNSDNMAGFPDSWRKHLVKGGGEVFRGVALDDVTVELNTTTEDAQPWQSWPVDRSVVVTVKGEEFTFPYVPSEWTDVPDQHAKIRSVRMMAVNLYHTRNEARTGMLKPVNHTPESFERQFKGMPANREVLDVERDFVAHEYVVYLGDREIARYPVREFRSMDYPSREEMLDAIRFRARSVLRAETKIAPPEPEPHDFTQAPIRKLRKR